MRRKVRLVEGDVTKEDFGIRADMRAILEQSVDIVFHLAGTVKFDEPMRFFLFLFYCYFFFSFTLIFLFLSLYYLIYPFIA